MVTACIFSFYFLVSTLELNQIYSLERLAPLCSIVSVTHEIRPSHPPNERELYKSNQIRKMKKKKKRMSSLISLLIFNHHQHVQVKERKGENRLELIRTQAME